MLPFTSINAASSIGTGTARDLEAVLDKHTLFISATGSPAGFVVHLEGSHDGTDWHDLATANEGLSQITVTTHLVRFVRANWTSINGGTSPTVTATIASE